ncbi:MAG: hypothetical protein H0T44_13835 [Gemmatimonadales bacterium]|nr:hypothetical protein [Gemmatimonadales bacterium]
MGTNAQLQLWGGRLCLGTVAALSLTGYYYGNIRFVPVAAGFAIMAALCYSFSTTPPHAPRRLASSGQHQAL